MTHQVTQVVSRKDLIQFFANSKRYKHLLNEVAFVKDEYTAEEIAALMKVKDVYKIKQRIRRRILVGGISKADLLRIRKDEAAEIAKELGYGEEVIGKIKEAANDAEIDRILFDARHSEKRYMIGVAAR